MGRVTETKPLGGDTGPTGVTAPSTFAEPAPQRRYRNWLWAAALAVGVVVVWRHEGSKSTVQEERTRVEATRLAPIGPRSTQPEGAQPAVPAPAAPAPSTDRILDMESPRVAASAQRPKPVRSVHQQKAPAGPAAEVSAPRQRTDPKTDPLFGLPLEADDSK
jgi:hypothetical protein